MPLTDDLAAVERQINALCARRSELVHEFAVARVEAAIGGEDFVPEVVERSVVEGIGLACGVSRGICMPGTRECRSCSSPEL